MDMDYKALFEDINPDFFERENIRSIPEMHVFAELVLDLRTEKPLPSPNPYPAGIRFGVYQGQIGKLREAVGQVNAGWVPLFKENDRAFCAFDGEKIAAFCSLLDWGRHLGLHISGPGCVGTVPEYRERGIGMEMIRRATKVLIEEEYDLSWIHYTHIRHWYEKLGYKTVLMWNSRGLLPNIE